jgi:hypothetical protein
MKVAGRAAAAGLAALVLGLTVSWISAAVLRSGAPEAELIWRVAPPSKVAIWTFAGAHGTPLHVEAGAEVTNERVREGVDMFGRLLGREESVIPTPKADLNVRVAPLMILALVGFALAFAMRSSGATTPVEAASSAAIAAGVYGIGLAILVTTSSAKLGFEGRIVSAGVEATMSPVTALVVGAVWAGAFALIGGLAAPAVTEKLSTLLRAIGAGMRRGSAVAAGTAGVLLAVLAISRGGGGLGGMDGSLAALAVFLLGLNVVGAGVVLAHGVNMSVSLDAGPLAQWTRLGYTPEGASLPPTRWLFLLVPLLGGFFAGRAMRGRSNSVASAAVAFGVAWGAAMAVLAAMLRVEVLSSFSLGSLDAGGGASVPPLLALLLGFVWGSVMSAVGMLVGTSATVPAVPVAPVASVAPISPVAPAAPVAPVVPACASCGSVLTPGDRFCAACGAAV